MPKAVWNGVVLAESDETIIVEGNHYFPPQSINTKYFEKSNKNTLCPWKGFASYYTVVADGKTNTDAAWYYPNPTNAVKHIKDYIAFWRGISVLP